ncbi:hypothetical protein M0R36_11405 [bacterium]|jgi:hypothetical protein|nr:hypothetical protein [bacterium]
MAKYGSIFLMRKTVRFQTVSYKSRTTGSVPYIRIANKILEKYGFRCGDKIVIVYQKEKLTVFTSRECPKIING